MISTIFFVFLGLASKVFSQTGKTTATCTYAEWTFFKGNSPCQMWANLQAACDSNASVGSLDVSANSNARYPSPSGSSATPCQCNVVAYNLMAGCTWCQPLATSGNWVEEARWKIGCTNYNSTGLPSQASSLASQIPAWAFLVQNGDSWFSLEASTIEAGGTTPIASLSSTRTFGGTIPTRSTFGGAGTVGFTGSVFSFTGTRFPAATITGPFNGGDDFGPIDTANVAKAVGIAVGIILGLYVLLGAIVLAIFFIRQNKRKAWYGPTAQFYRDGGRMVQQGGQPMLSPDFYGQQQSQNPFTNPSPTGSPATTASPPAGGAPYHPNVTHGQGIQGYNNQYSGYDPQAVQPNTYTNVHQQQHAPA